MAIIGGDQGKAGESKGSGRKADDLRLSCLCLLLSTCFAFHRGLPTAARFGILQTFINHKEII